MPSLNTGNAILSNPIKVDSSYNVGIGGAASGSYKLQVTGTANFTSDVFGLTGFYTRNSADTFIGSTNNTSGIIVNGTTLVTKIVSGGNTVATFANAGAATFSSSASEPFIINSSNATTLNTQYKYNNGTTLGYIGTGQGLINGGGSTIFAIRSENSMAFSVSGGNTAMTITSGGNVGIGVTPNTWTGTNVKALQVYNTSISGSLTWGASFGWNNYYNTGWKYIFTGTAGKYDIGGDEHIWSSAASGTAGSTITFLDRMKINSAGNTELIKAGLAGVTDSYGNNLNFRLTQTNGQSVIGAGIAVQGKSSWGGDLVFLTHPANGTPDDNYTERMRITSGGQVQVKQGADTTSDGFGLVNNASLNIWGLVNGGDSNLYFSLNYTSKAVINTNGAYTQLSDINKKKDFEDSSIGLNAILGLKPTLYRMTDDNETIEKQLGFIAQEVKEFIPQAYVENKIGEDKFIGLQDRPIIAALVKAIQELNQTVQNQQQQINSLINR